MLIGATVRGQRVPDRGGRRRARVPAADQCFRLLQHPGVDAAARRRDQLLLREEGETRTASPAALPRPRDAWARYCCSAGAGWAAPACRSAWRTAAATRPRRCASACRTRCSRSSCRARPPPARSTNSRVSPNIEVSTALPHSVNTISVAVTCGVVSPEKFMYVYPGEEADVSLEQEQQDSLLCECVVHCRRRLYKAKISYSFYGTKQRVFQNFLT